MGKSNSIPFFSKEMANLLLLLSSDAPPFTRPYDDLPKALACDYNALWSFPRSGNHWVRFITEYLTNSPTHGCITNHSDTPV